MNPNNHLLKAAYEDLENGAIKKALTKAKKAHEVLKETPETFLLLIEIADAQEDFNQAINLTEEAIKKHANNHLLLLKKASILMDQFEELDEAFSILKKIIKEFDKYPASKKLTPLELETYLDAYAMMIDYYRLINSYDKALEFAEKSIKNAPQSKRAKLFLATQLFEMGDFKKAYSLIEMPQLKNNQDFLWLKAQILQAESRFIEADKIFLKLAKKIKDFHPPIRLSEEEFNKYLQKALRIYPYDFDFVKVKLTIEIADVVPIHYLEKLKGKISPLNHILTIKDENNKSINIVLIQKNIENLADNKKQIIKIIESEIIHGIFNAML